MINEWASARFVSDTWKTVHIQLVSQASTVFKRGFENCAYPTDIYAH